MMRNKIFLLISSLVFALVLGFGEISYSNDLGAVNDELSLDKPGQAAPAAAEPEFKPTANVGGLLRMNWNMKISGKKDGDDSHGFALNNARIWVTGLAAPNVQYNAHLKLEKLTGNAPVTGTNALNKGVEMAWLKFTHFAAMGINITVGADYMSFNRYYHTPVAALLMMDRPLSDRFIHQSDIGINLDGRFMKGKIYYALGIWNGAGGTLDGVTNDTSDDSYQITLRLQFDPLGEWDDKAQYFKRDFKMTFGLGVLHNPNYKWTDVTGFPAYSTYSSPGSGTTGTKGIKLMALTFDVGINWQKLYFYASGNMIPKSTLNNGHASYNAATGFTKTKESYFGYNVELSYDLLPKDLRASLRFESFDEAPLVAKQDGAKVINFGLSWYVGQMGHKMKIQPEAALYIDRKDTTKKKEGYFYLLFSSLFG